jgi:RNA polymerase sigma-70 factor (ECF subfamily)
LVNFVPDLLRFGRSLVKDPTLAEDLASDTVLKAIDICDSFEEGTDMKSWLFQIEVGLFHNMRRRALRRARTEDRFESSDSETAMSVVGENAPQESAIELSDVVKAIDTLPADQKAAIYLVCYVGHSVEDAAQILECKLGTLYSRISRARSTLLNVLSDKVPLLEHEEVSFRP